MASAAKDLLAVSKNVAIIIEAEDLRLYGKADRFLRQLTVNPSNWFFCCNQQPESSCRAHIPSELAAADAIIILGDQCSCELNSTKPVLQISWRDVGYQTEPLKTLSESLESPAKRYLAAKSFFDAKPKHIGIVFRDKTTPSTAEQCGLLNRLLHVLRVSRVQIACHPITNEKLENFQDAEAFVYIGCSRSFRTQILRNHRAYRRPVLSFAECLLALDVMPYTGDYAYDWNSSYANAVESFLVARGQRQADEDDDSEDHHQLVQASSYDFCSHKGLSQAEIMQNHERLSECRILEGRKGIACSYENEKKC